jgi:hypothetical protein
VLGLEQGLAQGNVDRRGSRAGERFLKVNEDVVVAHLFDHRLKARSFPVQEDDTLARSQSQDPGHVFGLGTGYRKRALGAGDLVNEKTTHEQPHGVLEYWSIGKLEQIEIGTGCTAHGTRKRKRTVDREPCALNRNAFFHHSLS